MLTKYVSFFPIEDPIVIFAIVLVLMLGAPIVMGRFRLPGMIGLLLAGAVLGPNGLGILARDRSFILLGAVGLIYIMFTAALEVDLAVFKRYRVQGAVFGVLTFVLPQGIGTLMARFLLGFDWPAAVLLASMFASHTLLAYPIVSRLGLSKNQAVTTTIGGTMVTDVAALLVLAVIAGSTQGEMTESFWWRLGVSILVFVTVILVGLPRIGRWFFRRMAKDGLGEFVFVLSSVFVCAGLSELAGLEPIIGAFLAGIALNPLIPHSGALMNRIVFSGEAIFIPFFLLSVGMLVDVEVVFGGSRTIIVALSMLGAVTVTKFLAAHGARLVFGFSSAEGQVMFGLSVAQAAATLAVVVVGERIGLFDDTVVNGTIVMILGTCVLSPLVTDRYARKVAEVDKDKSEDDIGHQRILVPFFDPEVAKEPMRIALMLRGHGPLYPLFVAKDGDDVGRRVAAGEKALAKITDMASGADVTTHPLVRVDSSIGTAILRARKELRITDIVCGWDGTISSEERIFGSVLDEVAADRSSTLTVARLPHALNTTTRVLLIVPPHAGEDKSFDAAIATAKRLARGLSAPLLAMPIATEESATLTRIKKIKPSCTVRSKPVESWEGLIQALADRVEEHDMVVVLGVHPQSPAFRPECRTLPRRLVTRFPEVNLAIIYAAEEGMREDTPTPEPPKAQPSELVVPLEHVVLGIEGVSLTGVVARLASAVRAKDPERVGIDETAQAQVVASCRRLGPGVHLAVHRDRNRKRPAVWLGISRDGVDQSGWPERGQLFFLAVTGETLDAAWLIDLVAKLRLLLLDPALTAELAGARQLSNVARVLESLGRSPASAPRPAAPPEADPEPDTEER